MGRPQGTTEGVCPIEFYDELLQEKLRAQFEAVSVFDEDGRERKNISARWATFQVLRKTNASLEVHTSSDLEQKRAALRALEAAVRRKRKPTQKPPSELAKSA